MSTTHTPAPWETGSGAGETVFSAMRDGVRQKIATCYLPSDSEESHANARLIAAAPDLLDVVKLFVHHFTGRDISRGAWPLMDQAIDAIAKAEGAA